MPDDVTPIFKTETRKKSKAKKPRTTAAYEDYQANKRTATAVARGRCMAPSDDEFDLHHQDCPGYSNRCHHILERRNGGTDAVANLLPIWGGDHPLGITGCHGRIHEYREQAERLGAIIVPDASNTADLVAAGVMYEPAESKIYRKEAS